MRTPVARVYRVVVFAHGLLFDEVIAPTSEAAIRQVMRVSGVVCVHHAYATLLEAGTVHPAVRFCDVRVRLPRQQEVK